MNFTQAVTSLEHLTDIDSTSIPTPLRNYKNLATSFLSSDGEILSLTPTYLLVSVGIVGGYCKAGVDRTISLAQNDRVFLKDSMIGLGPTPAPTIAALDASRTASISSELAKGCLERELNTEEMDIVTSFVAEAKASASDTPAVEFKNIVGQVCTIICASFDALRF